MSASVSRSDGRPAEPMPYQGWKARVEQWAHRHNRPRLAAFMARWDERGLGR